MLLPQVGFHSLFRSGQLVKMMHEWLPPAPSCSSDTSAVFASEFRRRLHNVGNAGDFEDGGDAFDVGGSSHTLSEGAGGRGDGPSRRRWLVSATASHASAAVGGSAGSHDGITAMDTDDFVSLFVLWGVATLAMLIASSLKPAEYWYRGFATRFKVGRHRLNSRP